MVKGQGGNPCVHQAGSHQGPDTSSVVTQDKQLGELMSQHLPPPARDGGLLCDSGNPEQPLVPNMGGTDKVLVRGQSAFN